MPLAARLLFGSISEGSFTGKLDLGSLFIFAVQINCHYLRVSVTVVLMMDSGARSVDCSSSSVPFSLYDPAQGVQSLYASIYGDLIVVIL